MITTHIICIPISIVLIAMAGGTQSINQSKYEIAHKKQKPTNGGAKENSPCVKSYRQIENTIMLNPKAMSQLKMIGSVNNKLTFSDLIILLIKEYRAAHPDINQAMTLFLEND